MTADPFGRALADHHHDRRGKPLIQRDGEQTLEHPIEQIYFDADTGEGGWVDWFESSLEGPLLDIGAGVGKHTLYFQEQFETVAIEVSDHLVSLMEDRGVERPHRADMFDLTAAFDRDRFQSALAFGTQAGLAGSIDGLRAFLHDLAVVTEPDGTAVIDGYDPERDGASELLGYRPDPAPGLASRVMSFEYEGAVGDILLFRLFSPERFREATVGTAWEMTEVRYDEGDSAPHYCVALSKE